MKVRSSFRAIHHRLYDYERTIGEVLRGFYER